MKRIFICQLVLIVAGVIGSYGQTLTISPKIRSQASTPIAVDFSNGINVPPALRFYVTTSGFTPAGPLTYTWTFVGKLPDVPPYPSPLNGSPGLILPGPHPVWARRFNLPVQGAYKWRLCASNGTQTACDTVTLIGIPPSNTPPQLQVQDLDTLFKPTVGKKMGYGISDPANTVNYHWLIGSAPNNPTPFVPPAGVVPLATIKADTVIFPELQSGNYEFTLRAVDNFSGVSQLTETFIVIPPKSSLGINITPPGTAPDPNVLFTPVNNVPLNAEITGINVYNDKIRYEWTQIAGPTAISLPPPAYTASPGDLPVSSSTFNCPPISLNALAYGVYTLRLRAEDEYYPGTFVEQDITFEVKPPASNLDVTVTPATPTTIDPYNNFAFSGKVTGINANSDVIRTYWRQETTNPVQFNTAPFTETFASPNVVPLGTTEVNSNGTLNSRITEGTYVFWYVARDIFYNVADSAKIEIIVKPDESTFALTIDPSEEKTITKTPDGWILNVGEDPQDVPFNVTGKVTGISDKTDYVRTYWRMVFEPDASGGTLNPPLPHTAASPKEIALGTTSDEGQVSFTIANTDAGTYDLWYVVRDVFYNKADSIKTRILVKRPVSIQPLAAFTPNGDGMNDVWTIRNIESFPDVGVRIVNERGELVFETSSVARLPERGWDGRRRDGKLAPEGAYYYQFFDNRDQTLVATGSFVILR
jgi:gliding motility-associated-like protein